MLLRSIREALVTQTQNSNSSGDGDEIEVARLKCPQYFGEVDITIIITYILVIQTLYSKLNLCLSLCPQVALLLDQPRAATVTAAGQLKCVKLDRAR